MLRGQPRTYLVHELVHPFVAHDKVAFVSSALAPAVLYSPTGTEPEDIMSVESVLPVNTGWLLGCIQEMADAGETVS